MKCPVCGGKENTIIRKSFDDRYGYPELFSIAECSGCGHLMTSPRISDTDVSELYEKYYPRKSLNVEDVICGVSKPTRLSSRITRWWNGTDNQGQYSVSPQEVMLDVGCGSGASLLEAQALGAEAYGTEADPNVKRIAAELELNIHFGSLYDEPFQGKSFELIVMNQVIEHMPDPDLALQRLRNRLSSKGRIVLVFPNSASLGRRISGERWINWHIPYHQHHFNFKSFSRLALRCELEVVRSRTVTPNEWTLLQIRSFFSRPD